MWAEMHRDKSKDPARVKPEPRTEPFMPADFLPGFLKPAGTEKAAPVATEIPPEVMRKRAMFFAELQAERAKLRKEKRKQS